MTITIHEDRRSDAYQFTTTDLSCPELRELRKEVAAQNFFVEWEPCGLTWIHPIGMVPGLSRTTKVVSVKGRAGKKNPHVTRKQMRDGSVPLAIATRYDVYVHTRTVFKRDPDYVQAAPTTPTAKTATQFHGEFEVALDEFIDRWDEVATLTPEYGVLDRRLVDRTIDDVLLRKLQARRTLY